MKYAFQTLHFLVSRHGVLRVTSSSVRRHYFAGHLESSFCHQPKSLQNVVKKVDFAKTQVWKPFYLPKTIFSGAVDLGAVDACPSQHSLFPNPSAVPEQQFGSRGGILGILVLWTEQCSAVPQQENQPTENADTKVHLGSKVHFLSLISESTEGKITAGLCILNIKQDFFKSI